VNTVRDVFNDRSKRVKAGETFQDSIGLLMNARDDESGEAMSFDEIADNFVTLCFAGFDTYASHIQCNIY
jgi:cytochrome P450